MESSMLRLGGLEQGLLALCKVFTHVVCKAFLARFLQRVDSVIYGCASTLQKGHRRVYAEPCGKVQDRC